jgi:hypothetical protein
MASKKKKNDNIRERGIPTDNRTDILLKYFGMALIMGKIKDLGY